VELHRAWIMRSPTYADKVRLVGEVDYDRRFIGSERIWFEVPERYADDLTDSGNPWLACLIPLAVTLGEPLRIGRPVDRKLYDNAQELMRIWVGWYPHLHIVPIEAEIVEDEHPITPGRTASFFSGGVDGFHTVLHFDASANTNLCNPIDDLIFVWGFDVPLRNRDGFARIRDSLQSAAIDLGKELVVVATNLRETRCRKADFSSLAHVSILASAALTLEEKFSKVLISSSYNYRNLHRWGSHPQTDLLYSTDRTDFIHYGAEFSRLEKTAYVVQSDIVMRSLRVCWISESGENCGACNKCYLTMMALELFDTLDRCTTFTEQKVDLESVAKIYSSGAADEVTLRDIRSTAQRMGRHDLAEAVDRSFDHSDRLNQSLLFTTLWKVKQWLPNKPLMWRSLRPVRRIFKACIRKITGSTF
jgi:hypothetical protein